MKLKSDDIVLVEGNNELNVQMVPIVVPPVGEPYLISLNLPSVPSGDEFWPEATLYLPLQDYQDYGYGFSLDVDESFLEGDIYYTNIMAWGFVPIGSPRLRADGSGPLPLDNPANIYIVRGTRFAHPWTTRPSKARYAIRVPSYWGYQTQIIPIPPGSYPVLGSILLSEYTYPYGPYSRPKRVTRGSWNLGVVGTLEVI